jgi:cysteinyl-tRNA synthetase
MLDVILYNTLTRSKIKVNPIKDAHLNMFVCGPTVYDHAHIGHGKTFAQFDMLVKFLRLAGYDVFYLQNITDIDDKIIQRAADNKESITDLTERYYQSYLVSMQALHVDSVSKYVKATDKMANIISQVKRLIDKKVAYKTDDGWYFEVATFADYGKLSGRTNIEENDAQSRIDSSEQKKGWNDFCLWKLKKNSHDPSWHDDVLGEGRPGWHIEDTAITEDAFGPRYDIHGGAIDLIFPHHEAEVAQMETISGESPLARHWVHTGFINVGTVKMSKSKSNFILLDHMLAEHGPRVLRYIFAASHYREGINITPEVITNAKDNLRKIDEALWHMAQGDQPKDTGSRGELYQQVMKALADDFNTPKALTIIHNNLSKLPNTQDYIDLLSIDSIFSFLIFTPGNVDYDKINSLVSIRAGYKDSKEYDKADVVKAELESMGIKLYDKADQTLYRVVDQNLI